MVSMPRCGCQGKPARYSSGRSLRKSSSSRNGSKSLVFPKPKARRRCTPAPSMVGFDLRTRLTGRIDMFALLLPEDLSSLQRDQGVRMMRYHPRCKVAGGAVAIHAGGIQKLIGRDLGPAIHWLAHRFLSVPALGE